MYEYGDCENCGKSDKKCEKRHTRKKKWCCKRCEHYGRRP